MKEHSQVLISPDDWRNLAFFEHSLQRNTEQQSNIEREREQWNHSRSLEFWILDLMSAVNVMTFKINILYCIKIPVVFIKTRLLSISVFVEFSGSLFQVPLSDILHLLLLSFHFLSPNNSTWRHVLRSSVNDVTEDNHSIWFVNNVQWCSYSASVRTEFYFYRVADSILAGA